MIALVLDDLRYLPRIFLLALMKRFIQILHPNLSIPFCLSDAVKGQAPLFRVICTGFLGNHGINVSNTIGILYHHMG